MARTRFGLILSVFLVLLMTLGTLTGCQSGEPTQGGGSISDATATTVRASPTPEKLTTAQLVALNRPAVVLITAVWSGNVVERDTGEPYVIVVSPQNELLAQVEIPNPMKFGGFRGSGLIVNPNGYILTAAHVVHEKEEDVETALYEAFVQWAAEEVPKHYQLYGLPPWPATEEDLKQLRAQVRHSFRLTNIKREIKVFTGRSISGIGTVGKGYIADVRKLSPWEEKDIAIIKIEAGNLPVMKLGDSDKVQELDSVIVIGYPASPTLHPMLAEESVYESSVTKGIVSARKTMPDGSVVLQTDAAIVGGNSGGPALNEDGEVIGIASFGTPRQDPREPPLVPGFNFLRPSNVAKDLLREAAVDNVEGLTNICYRKAMQLYWNGEYADAIEEFESVMRLYPGHPYAQQYLTKCQEMMAGQ